MYNTIAPNDEYVKYMPETELKKYIGMSQVFGRSGVETFESKAPMLTQTSAKIFNHTNTIKRDVIETKWMPFLNANRYSYRTEMIEYIKRNANE